MAADALLYSYGWDWGPILMTVGPWKPIFIHSYNARLSDVRIHPLVDENLGAQIRVALAATSDVVRGKIILRAPDKTVLHQGEVICKDGETATLLVDLHSSSIQLWYPVGYGEQPLYACEVELLDEVSSSSSG
jgi:beta-mannosidase